MICLIVTCVKTQFAKGMNTKIINIFQENHQLCVPIHPKLETSMHWYTFPNRIKVKIGNAYSSELHTIVFLLLFDR